MFSGTSFHSDNLVKLKDVIPKDEPIVFVVGAMAHGSVSLFIFQELSCEVLFGWNSWKVTILSAKHVVCFFTSLMFNSFLFDIQFKLLQATTSEIQKVVINRAGRLQEFQKLINDS